MKKIIGKRRKFSIPKLKKKAKITKKGTPKASSSGKKNDGDVQPSGTLLKKRLGRLY
jgi:hypothetical protein